MRILQVHCFYDHYLQKYYEARPELNKAPYDRQIATLLNDGFSAGHLLTPSLERLGHEARLLIANCLPAQAKWMQEHNDRCINSENWMFEVASKQIERYQPEVLYLSHPIGFDSRFVEALRWKPGVVAGWRAASIPPGTDWSAFDVILSHLSVCKKKAMALGAGSVTHFNPGFPAFIAKSVKPVAKKYDVVFSGQWTTEHRRRNEYLNHIARASEQGERPYTIGYFLATTDPNSIPERIAKRNLGPRWGLDMYQALSSGNIVVNAEIDLAGGEAGNMRLFEATGMGAFLLTEYHDNIGEYFQPGVEVETFKDPAELVDKIRYYLRNPAKRDAIARQGQKRCRRDYSMQARSKKFADICRVIRKQKPTSKAAECIPEGSISDILQSLQKTLASFPRRVPGKLMLDGIPLYYADMHSFYHQAIQIFGQHIYGFESETQEPVIVDCGAHIGLAALYFATRYPKAKIFAYEADPAIARLLMKNITERGFDQVKVESKAVWINENGVNFTLSGDDSGCVDPKNSHSEVNVPSMRLREFLRQHQVDLLKLDIEGAEYDVIQDCDELLNHVNHLIIEIHKTTHTDIRFGEILSILERHNFEYTLGDLHAADWIKPLSPTPFSAPRTGRFIITVFAWKPRQPEQHQKANPRSAENTSGRGKNRQQFDHAVSSVCNKSRGPARRPKILQVADHQMNGGAAKAGYRLFKGLQEKDENVKLVTFSPPEDGNSSCYSWQQLFASHAAKFLSSPDGFGNPPTRRWSDIVNTVVQGERPDIVNIHNIHEAIHFHGVPLQIMESLAARARLVFTLHDMWLLTGRCAYSEDCTQFESAACNKGCKTCSEYPQMDPVQIAPSFKIKRDFFKRYPDTVIITPSRWLARQVGKSHLKDLRTEVIPYGIDLTVYHPDLNRAAYRRSIGIAEDEFVLLIAAANVSDPRKGAHILWKALSAIRLPVTVHTVGRVGLIPEFPPTIKLVEHGYVTDVREMARLYCAADAMICPSLSDNLPCVLIESVACGTPCVGFDVGGIPEIIRPGKTGWLCPETNAASLGDTILRIVQRADRAKDLRATCRKVAEEEYASALQASRYQHLYTELFGSTRRVTNSGRAACRNFNSAHRPGAPISHTEEVPNAGELQQAPHSSGLSAVDSEQDEQFNRRYTEIEKLIAEGRKKEARENLRELAFRFPKVAVVQNDLGVLAYQDGEKLQAYTHYQKAAELEPGNITYLKNLADFCCVEMGKVEEALKLYTQVLTIQPEDTEALLSLGHICVALERFDDAADFYRRILRSNPGHGDAEKFLAVLQNNSTDSDNQRLHPAAGEKGSGRPAGNNESRYLVSAIVSTYNAERYIRGCLEDLESQTIADQLEIVVVNSGSEQNEEAIVKEFQQRFSNIQYIKTETRETVYAAWNRGIRAARGKYITNANTDDRHRRDAFAVMVNILETLPEIALVYADAAITETENETFDCCTPVGMFRWMNWNRQDLLHKGCFVGPQPMWRAEVHREYGFFDDSFVTSGDYEFWLRISQTNDFIRIPVCLGLYLRSVNSIEHSNRPRQKAENDRIYRIYANALAEKKIVGRRLPSGTEPAGADPAQSSRTAMPEAATVPSVSVVVDASGSQASLRKCLESLKKHTPSAQEIFIVGSLSSKAKWLKRLVETDSRFRVVQAKKNAGPAALFNRGVESASGDFILLLSGDVVVFGHWLSDMLQRLSIIPGGGIVGPVTNRSNGIQQVERQGGRGMQAVAEFADDFRIRNRHRWIRCNHMEGFCLLFHRRLTEEIGLLDETLGDERTEDVDFCIRASLAGFTNAVAGDVYVHRTAKSSDRRNMKRFNQKWPVTDGHSETGKKYLTFVAMERGQQAFEEGNLDRGVDFFLEGIKLSPDNRVVYYRFAENLINSKRHQDALEVLAEIPAHDEDLQRIELEAYASEGLGNDAEAQRLAERALHLNSGSAAALNLMGMLAYRQGALEQAEKYYRKAIERNPGFGDPYTNLGALKWETEPDTALDLLERAFILSPFSDDIASNYHTAITSAQDYRRAETIFNEAAGAYPHNKNIRYKIVDMLLKQEKYEAAMKTIESAIAEFGIDDGILDAALAVRDRLGADKTVANGTKKATVSLCMIVKNEESDIGRCLNSVKPVVDEMIVVDTGSDDHTRDIAQAFGAKVFELEWTEDFAAARNFAIDQASGAWTFHLDADEVISHLDHDALRKLVRRSKPAAYIFNTRNYVLDVNQVGWEGNDGRYAREEIGSGWIPSEKVRLFPRDPRVRFEFPVHELVEPSLRRCGIPMKTCAIPVHHYGTLNQQKNSDKKAAYYAIGRKKLAEMGDDTVALRELAIQAEILGKHDEAIELWQRFIAIEPNYPQSYINMGIAYCNQGKFEALLETAEKALALNPDLKEAQYNFALAKLHLDAADEAAISLEKLLAHVGEYPPAHFLLAAAYGIAERKTESLNVFKQLQQSVIAPNLPSRCQELARSLVDAGRSDRAMVFLQTAMDSGINSTDLLKYYSACLETAGGGDLSGREEIDSHGKPKDNPVVSTPISL